MLRGQQILKANKFDYSRHPDSAAFKPVPLSITVPGDGRIADIAPGNRREPNPSTKKPQSKPVQKDMRPNRSAGDTVIQENGDTYKLNVKPARKKVYDPAAGPPGLE